MRVADGLTLLAGAAGATAGALFASALAGRAPELDAALLKGGSPITSLELLFDYLIPGLAGAALLVTVLLAARAIAAASALGAPPRFGRKSLVATGSAVLFAFSCFYRALNIADEGAAMCRGAPTPFNAPAAGRFVATIGEVSSPSVAAPRSSHSVHTPVASLPLVLIKTDLNSAPSVRRARRRLV